MNKKTKNRNWDSITYHQSMEVTKFMMQMIKMFWKH